MLVICDYFLFAIRVFQTPKLSIGKLKDSVETDDFTDLVSAIDFQLFRLNLIQLNLLAAKNN